MAESSNIQYTPVRELKPGSKNINFQVMILEQVGDYRRTKEGQEVRTFKVADKSGSVNLCLFGDNGRHLRPGDVVRILRGYCSLFRNFLIAYVGKGGDIKRVGEFCFPICEEPNMSEINFAALQQQQQQSADPHQVSPHFGPPPQIPHGFAQAPHLDKSGGPSPSGHGGGHFPHFPPPLVSDPRLLSTVRSTPFAGH